MFRRNSACLFNRTAKDNYKTNSGKELSLSQTYVYDPSRYELVGNFIKEHPNISLSYDKILKKKVIVKKCRFFEKELTSLQFTDCKFIEKMLHYDVLQKIVIYNFRENRDLNYYMAYNPFTIEQSTNVVLKPILQALQYMHNKKYAHRDVKPENILYFDDGCKLIDFEFCEKLPSRGHFSNRNGTPEFMSPELTYRKGCLESDLWSLGMVYYECLHKKLPFETSSHDQIFDMIRKQRFLIKIDLDLTVITILKILLGSITTRKNCYNDIFRLIESCSF